jgi:UDP-3-O-[3-hydroxymyristoyl] glucosamine N-acyltransferase
VVGERVRLGRDAVLHANVVVYDDATIGDDFVAHAGAVVREGVRIGDRVVLHAGAVIGTDGFGFLPLPDGNRRIPQVGTVVLEDDVEIGANATVDRAALGATVVGRGTKIDNLVMIGHGCRIGAGCLLAAQVGLAGSTHLGARVMMGGQAGAAGHLTIGDGAQIAAQSGLHRDIPAGARYGGYPAMDVGRWRRVTMSMPRLPELFRRLRRVEQRLGLATAADEEER